jgi:hypothetical protein
MALGTRQTPQMNSPVLAGATITSPDSAPAEQVLSTAGGVVTLTAAQILSSLIPCDCQDAQTLTLPTAALLAAARPFKVGASVRFNIINYGDSTITVAVGTGITNKVIDSEDAILSIATHIGTEWALVCTAKANPSDPSTSDTFDLYLLATSTVTS